MWLFLIASRSIWTAVFNVTLYERTHKKGMMIKLILRQQWLKFFLGVYLLSSPSGNLDYGTISRFTITAVDKGSPSLTGTTYVDIIYKEATTTTTTTTAAPSTYNFWDDSGAVAAFSIAMVLGFYLILLRFRDNKIISTDCFHGKMNVIVRPNETNATFFFFRNHFTRCSSILLVEMLLYGNVLRSGTMWLHGMLQKLRETTVKLPQHFANHTKYKLWNSCVA